MECQNVPGDRTKPLSCAIRPTARKQISGARIRDCVFPVTGGVTAKLTAAEMTLQMRQKAVRQSHAVPLMSTDVAIIAAFLENSFVIERWAKLSIFSPQFHQFGSKRSLSSLKK
jgi:hypothetical protein